MNKPANKIELLMLNDTSRNVNSQSIPVEEGTVTHVALINTDIYYRLEVPATGKKAGWTLICVKCLVHNVT